MNAKPSGGRPGAVTLAAVARQAGVHVSTASRALNESSTARSGISAATVERIRALAAELGYFPDPAATALRTRRTRVIGVLVPRLTDVVLATVYEGIDDVAIDAGYHTVVANTRDDMDMQRKRLDTLLARRVDGIVLGDARLDSPLVDGLSKAGVPYVLVSRRLPGHISVTCDDIRGGRLVAEHLLGLGHRRLAVVAGEPYASTGVERTRGFLDACSAAGVEVPDECVATSSFDAAGGRAAAEKLLAARPRPTAIFAVNDFAAVGVMGAVRDHGLAPGRDVAVVGYNDVPVVGEMPVPLTTVHSPMFSMGQTAGRTLLALLDGRPARSHRVRPHLVVRASTADWRRDY